MIEINTLLNYLNTNHLEHWAKILPEQVEQGLSLKRYGDLPQWYEALVDMPELLPSEYVLGDTIVIGHEQDTNAIQNQKLKGCLSKLIPWRKGPYSLFGIDIDTEWRSDWKWQRLLPHISALENRFVLDIGCGNGYHCWRMLEDGAKRVIGIDPSPRFIIQFAMIKKYLNHLPIDVLPLGIESLPNNLEVFDTTFSMGVFYHRRSPMDHLLELKNTLKPGGELILETLIIEGKLGEVLVPQGRYAMMNNVWFLPSVPTLKLWLEKCGFTDVRCVNINKTSTEEQRSTEWMRFHSLAQFLDPKDNTLTVEGYPAPQRAIFIAAKPG